MKVEFVVLNGVEHLRLEPDANNVVFRPAGEAEKAQYPHEYAAFKSSLGAPLETPAPEAAEPAIEPPLEPSPIPTE